MAEPTLIEVDLKSDFRKSLQRGSRVHVEFTSGDSGTLTVEYLGDNYLGSGIGEFDADDLAKLWVVNRPPAEPGIYRDDDGFIYILTYQEDWYQLDQVSGSTIPAIGLESRLLTKLTTFESPDDLVD